MPGSDAEETLTEMDQLIVAQYSALERLQKELVNFGKDGRERKTKHHYNVRLNRIEDTRKGFLDAHHKIIQFDDADKNEYITKDTLDEFENCYIDTVAQIKASYEERFSTPVSAPAALTSASNTVNPTAANVPRYAPLSDSAVKLPTLTLQEFNGEYTEWLSFYDSFLQIHNNDTLTNHQKFQYLKGVLSSSVKSVIGYIDITAENYEAAWKELNKRYYNKRVLFKHYMDKLMNQPNIHHETADELRTLHDVSRACVFSLEKIGINITACGELFAHILIQKLPTVARLEWEKGIGNSKDIPVFNSFIEFIETRFRTFEFTYSSSSKHESKPFSQNQQSKSSTQHAQKSLQRKENKIFHLSSKSVACPLCEQPHVLRKCFKFLQLSVPERKTFVDKSKICPNCIGHPSNISCSSTKLCITCNGRHHTLLHFNKNHSMVQKPINVTPSSSWQQVHNHHVFSTDPNVQLAANSSAPFVVDPNTQFAANHGVSAKSNCVLLATALIDIPDINGQLIRLRALIDQGSQQSIITERAAQRLKLPRVSICVGVRPMGQTQYKIVNKGVIVNIHSIIDSNFHTETTCAIMPNITSNLPLFPLNQKTWPHIHTLPLADPHFATPGQIDLLLAGDVHGIIIQSGLCKGQAGEPIAQNTSLGWILFGEIANQHHFTAFPVNCFHVSTLEIGNYIKKFYEIEEVSATRELSKEEKWTVDHYNSTYQRQANGKFMVRLPFKFLYEPSVQLGSSFAMAFKRFQWLQRRFYRDSKFHNAYTETFNDYKRLNQVKLVETINDTEQEPSTIKHFYLPHHAVIKENSITTKLRQVFDGSAKSSNGNSLNDILTTGPALQSDLVSIILNWRTHKFVFIADIEKMYRCIDIHPDDTDYQRLLWEENSQLCSYALQTVTFGIKPSAFIAINTLHTLADLEREKYPLAHTAIKKETYVDDVTTGEETIEKTITLSNQVIQMLRGAGFELRKWSSNSPEILKHIPTEYHEQNTTCLLNTSDSIKALGLCWSTTNDCFQFNVNFSIGRSLHTKRTVLSIIARLFDPLGWLNPFVTKAKLFLNKLWEANLDWDVELSSDLTNEWLDLVQQLQFINQITMPRWIQTSSENRRNELHVFCDASNKAYTTAIHLRTIDSFDMVHVNLLIAKSKLCPIRKPLCTPRAELCGAVLAVNVLDNVKENFRLKIDQIFLWTDSTIVLSWIRGDPNRWVVFVANRIHRILTSTEISNWQHVVSKDNVADLNSRGLSINELRDSTLWWKGPEWLSLPSNQWPKSPFNIVADDPNELRSKYKVMNHTTNEISRLDSILLRFSNFNRLRFSFAYCLRYIQILRNAVKTKKNSKSSNLSQSIKSKISAIPVPTAQEVQHAENALIRWIQNEHFNCEFTVLQKNQSLSRQSKIFRLNPFIDNNNMLRVGSRLTNALIPYEQKFPLILPSKHRIVSLLVDFYHKQTFHGGALVTANQLRQTYWIQDLRNFSRHYIQKCVICFKNKPILSRQLMGSLPSPRVNDQSRPFSATIIDYAGPYNIRISKGRGQRSHKGYVAVFTCMSTKAAHLEVVGDLSTQTFLHAFDRFIARRGICHDVHSDCGTNFVGADNQIQRTQAEFESFVSKEILPYMTMRNITWHFSPPGAPHFNGLAEAAVKSMKFHLHRIVGQAKLTFEEFSTVLARIEAVLNSRPISPMSSDPNDFTALTPGHFLIGSALLARPQPPTIANPVKRYQMMESIVQHFWNRFRKDILSTMQIRTKWLDQQPNLKLNDLVLIKDDRFPLNQWPMGRIVSLHPGADNLVRAVTIRTANGMLKRPITKLCLIPTQHDL